MFNIEIYDKRQAAVNKVLKEVRKEATCIVDVLNGVFDQELQVSAPRNKRVSENFVTRVPNTPEGKVVTDHLAIAVMKTNMTLPKDFFGVKVRLRLIKRGRKPVNGVKYSAGGMIKLKDAREIDVYIAAEYVYN